MPTCYCCQNLPFEQCCEPILNNHQKAKTPEALMRSRYSAFCTGNIAYLLQTSHADYLTAEHYTSTSLDSTSKSINANTTTNKTIQALKQTIENTQWVGLKILATKNQTVEFVAFFYESFKKAQPQQNPHSNPEFMQQKTTLGQLHERSRFVFENERWLYVDGDILSPIKLGRNDECYCGSQKKIKKCCLKT